MACLDLRRSPAMYILFNILTIAEYKWEGVASVPFPLTLPNFDHTHAPPIAYDQDLDFQAGIIIV